jgi:integrase
MSIKRRHVVGCLGGDCRCPWLLDYRPQGSAGQRKRVPFRTLKDAQLYQSQTMVKVQDGEYIAAPKIPIFKVAAEQWYASKIDRRPAHVANLRSRLDKHILPAIGEMKMDRIGLAEIEKLRDALRAAGRAARTINAILRIISAIFKSAINRGEIVRNPVDRVERAFVAAREIKLGDEDTNSGDDDAVDPDAILNPDEVAVMLNATKPGLYRALFMTAAVTGARAGELFALRWGDVEMTKSGEGSSIRVRRTVSWARLKDEAIRPRYFPPKTKAGNRKVPIPAELLTVLRAWKLQCPPTADNLVFPAADGRPLRRSNVLRYGLWPALDRAELRRVNIHSLRHSFASALIMDGTPVTEVQTLLGHANPAITLKIYSHWFRSKDSGAVGRLSKIILGNSGADPKWTKIGQKEGSIEVAKPVSA